jgi:3-hydroxyacyl-CoA dehydrogenase/enoyl-CoA hydratase/3-hydroxybutyryl-CoA epimerase
VNATAAAPLERPEERVVSLEVRRDGLAFVTLDDAAETHNTLTPAFGAQLLAAVERIEADASIAAAVLTSGKEDSFVVGANIDLLKSIKFATDAERLAREVAQALRRLEALKKPIVAAVHGAALGGGFELALACHAIVASDDPRTVVGLPEVRLGLMPAANGMLRVAARAGLRAAIDLAVTGKSLRGAAARRLALVDEVVPRAILMQAAARRAKALVGHVPRRRQEPFGLTRLALEENPIGRAILFKRAREAARAETRGHYPAPERMIDVIERLARKGFEAAAEVEAKAFGELVVSETAHRLIELFFATTALKRDAGVDERVEPRDVEHVAVLGGGLMGTGIAFVTLSAGVPVRLKERDDAAAGRALRGVKALLDGRLVRAQLTELERDAIFARLSATTDYSGLRNADLVIEAVFEDIALKEAIVRDVEPLVPSTCVIASNTSSIPIARIAQAALNPERVLGMHYFSPVPKMPLLEVVRADKTAAWAVATAVALGKRQGKTVIVVKDSPGFYTTRILAPLLNEAAHLVSEGVAVEAIDAAMVDWGFPVGPMQLLDEIGIDVAAHVAQVLHAAFGARMTPPGAMGKLLADDRKGRKNLRGFYRYDDVAGEGPRPVDKELYALLGVEPRTRLPVEEIQMRGALAMVNEALRSFGDGVLRAPRDGDVGALFGLGFPPFRGGPFRYVDTIGAAEVLRRVQGYADRFGERWRPAPLLVQMAKRGERFY